MSSDSTAKKLFARFVEHHVLHGEQLSVEELVGERGDLIEPLKSYIERYLRLHETLDRGPMTPAPPTSNEESPLPRFAGFQTIERLGSGGMGEVFKLRDLKLDRVVAGKVVRPDSRLRTSIADFLREARSMALFKDERIVQIHEFRSESDPPVIIMEYVEGFELNRVGPSLEYNQRARILLELCEALHRAHSLGIQHRDLKPSNIMLDASLGPKILDFGLSGGDPTRGHLKGTIHYLAPEQLDPTQPIDERTDVYALGVILYELLTGSVPYPSDELEDFVADLHRGQPRLPVEVIPGVPEQLQAIALKAMEKDPSHRYPSAREMALDIKRYLERRPVLARPTIYSSALKKRIRFHFEQIEEWLRLKLIYPHEAARLHSVYRQLDKREDDWIVESRALSWSQITLYLGAFLLVAGSLLYFGAHRFYEAVEGIAGPLIVLGAPFLGLNLAAHLLYRKEHKAVAVAFCLGGVVVLPLLLLIVFHEAGLWRAASGDERQFFEEGSVSNRQLQVAVFVAWGWSCWLALRTRTAALSTVFTSLAVVFTLTVLTDLDLKTWLEEERFDILAVHLVPIVVFNGFLGRRMEATERPWFSRPLYVSCAILFVVVLELLALEGRAFHYLDLSMAGYQGQDVSDPVLLDTLTAMSLNGVLIYLGAWVVERYGSELMKPASWLLFVISPFAILEPLAYLNQTAEYSKSFDWFYLGLALTITLLSHHRQRKSFYYAGIVNTGVALWLITEHYEWFDKPLWAVAVIVVGLVVFSAGFGFDIHERTRRRIGTR